MAQKQAHEIDGWVRTINLPKPSLSDNTADAERLQRALQADLGLHEMALDIDIDLLRHLADLVQRESQSIACTLCRDRHRWVLLGLHDPAEPAQPLGLAVDLGTTNLVLRIIGLKRGDMLAEVTVANPQVLIGPDILTRIHHAARRQGTESLSRLVREGIQDALGRMCRQNGLNPSDILMVTIAGNTAMTHLMLGLPTDRLIREPYIPVVNRPGIYRAEALDIRVNVHARVYVFPNIGSYFGGDVIAGILSSGMLEQEAVSILVDVGTNAEVVLGNRDWLIGCAGAAGPALESGVTAMGMTAGPGVIDRVAIDPVAQDIEWRTIEGLPARGICGSGLIDLAAELFLAGMIDSRGKFVSEVCGRRLHVQDDMPYLTVSPSENKTDGDELTISQADIDSLIRSKAAMYTILETITRSVGIALSDIDTFYVAGTFGAFIRPESAIALGMLPDLPRDRYRVLGNSAIEGAALVLKSIARFGEIDLIRRRMTYLELNVNQDFMTRFSAAKFLPHTDPGRFPSVTAGRNGRIPG